MGIEHLINKITEICKTATCVSIKAKKAKNKDVVYVSVRIKEGKKRPEKYIGKISVSEFRILKERVSPLLASTTTTRKKRSAQRRKKSLPPKEGSGVSDSVLSVGFGGGGSFVCVWGVHRLVLRFVRPWVSPLFLSGLGRVRFVERSKQRVVRLGLGGGRVVTLQVNSDGSAQVFLEASEDPLSFEEFFGFVEFWLPWLFRVITGRDVSLADFEVLAAPEINCDGRQVLLEGIKSMTLEDYYGEVVRVYTKGFSSAIPNGGTRVEVRANSWKGLGIDRLVDGMVSVVKLPVVLEEIKRDLELIKSGLPLSKIEEQQLADVVAARLGNLIYLTMEKFGIKMESAVRELGEKVMEALGPLFQRLEALEAENVRLKARINELIAERDVAGSTFDDLPEPIKALLLALEKEGYVRIQRDRIAYGDRVWAVILRRKGNIDRWIEEEAMGWVGERFGDYGGREAFKAVIKAIRFYDNRYNGKPGVPYDLWLEKFEMFLNE